MEEENYEEKPNSYCGRLGAFYNRMFLATLGSSYTNGGMSVLVDLALNPLYKDKYSLSPS
jgi:hypothetical protein